MNQKESEWNNCLTNYVNGFCNKNAPKTAKNEQESCELSYSCIKDGIADSTSSQVFEVMELSLKEATAIVVLVAIFLYGLHSRQFV